MALILDRALFGTLDVAVFAFMAFSLNSVPGILAGWKISSCAHFQPCSWNASQQAICHQPVMRPHRYDVLATVKDTLTVDMILCGLLLAN